jgi:hypothetical protein
MSQEIKESNRYIVISSVITYNKRIFKFLLCKAVSDICRSTHVTDFVTAGN